MTPIRVGLLGCGGIGLRHVQAYSCLFSQRQRSARLVAVHDADPLRARAAADRYERTTGIRVTVAERVETLFSIADAVDIALPTHLHREAAVEALARRKPVLVAKPLALTLEDCDAILSAAPDPDMVAIAENFRHAPGSKAIAHAIASGAIGFPVTMDLTNSIPSTELSRNAPPWHSDPEKAGDYLALELGVHEMAVQQAWFGSISRIEASRRGDGDYSAGGGLSAFLSFANGCTSQILFELEAGTSSDGWKTRRLLRGPKGFIASRSWCGWLDDPIERVPERLLPHDYIQDNLSSIFPDREERELILRTHSFGPSEPDDPVGYGIVSCLMDFVSSVAETRSPLVTGRAGREAVAACYAMLAAAQSAASSS